VPRASCSRRASASCSSVGAGVGLSDVRDAREGRAMRARIWLAALDVEWILHW